MESYRQTYDEAHPPRGPSLAPRPVEPSLDGEISQLGNLVSELHDIVNQVSNQVTRIAGLPAPSDTGEKGERAGEPENMIGRIAMQNRSLRRAISLLKSENIRLAHAIG